MVAIFLCIIIIGWGILVGPLMETGFYPWFFSGLWAFLKVFLHNWVAHPLITIRYILQGVINLLDWFHDVTAPNE